MKRYRIAVFHNLPPGGALRALVSWTAVLSRFGDIDLYHMRGRRSEQFGLREYIKNEFQYFFKPVSFKSRYLLFLRYVLNFINYFRYMLLSREIAAKMNAGSYDLIFMDFCMYYQLGPLPLFAKPPVVSRLHEYHRFVFEPPPSKSRYAGPDELLRRPYLSMLRRMNRKSVRKLKYIFSNSKYSRADILRIYGVNSELNYLWVDEKVFYPDPSAVKEKYFLTVGALSRVKGFEFVIEILSALPENVRYPLYLVAPSRNEYADELLTLSGRLNVELRIFCALSNDALADMYRRAFLTVFTPEKEPFGYIPIESMACGTPVIGISEGGLLETVLDGETGFLCPRDARICAGKIEQLAADGKLYEAFCEKSLRWTKEMWIGTKGKERMEEGIKKMFKAIEK